MARNLVVASTLLLMSISAQGGELVPPPDLDGYLAAADTSAEYAATVLHTLNELSARRRLTTLFPNEQSPFYGVQMNYVAGVTPRRRSGASESKKSRTRDHALGNNNVQADLGGVEIRTGFQQSLCRKLLFENCY
ncbi:MAG TPA: hypothetical protein VIL43_14200 [Burkholderiales bacterium]